jgi:hypothetical protein
MQTEEPMSLAEAFSIRGDCRLARRNMHGLVEMLVVAVCAMLCGADNFVQIHAWAEERPDWLRRLKNRRMASPRTTASAGSSGCSMRAPWSPVSGGG